MKKLMIAAALCTGLLSAQAAPLFQTPPQRPVTQQAPAKKDVKNATPSSAKATAAKKEHATMAHHSAMKAHKAYATTKATKTMKAGTTPATAPASEARPVQPTKMVPVKRPAEKK